MTRPKVSRTITIPHRGAAIIFRPRSNRCEVIFTRSEGKPSPGELLAGAVATVIKSGHLTLGQAIDQMMDELKLLEKAEAAGLLDKRKASA